VELESDTVSDESGRPSGAEATLADPGRSGVADTLPASVTPPPTDHVPTQLPPVDASTYDLREELGAGGMGRVVVARDRRLGRLLAIKVARATDPSVRVRFTREAVLTARLQHPSIIPVHEAGVWPGDEPFYAMKLVAGAPLSRLIARSATLDERLALIPNIIAVVDALSYAHAQRVIHRDLKPDNVIVGEYGETIVIDWGLAKELDAGDEDAEAAPYRRAAAGETVVGAAMGTPPYMAPEQAAGEPLDERADVYGLGAMLYHVLSGAPPYKGETADQVMDQVLDGPPVPLAEREAGVPKDLLAIVEKAMARNPSRRYANAKQLGDDLKRFQRGQLVAAHAYSRRELVRRWLARHRLPVVIASFAVVAIALAVTLWVRAELRDRELRGRRIAELLRADDADYATARAQLAASDFGGAATSLAREVDRLTGVGEREVDARREMRAGELASVQRLADFQHHAHAAMFLIGDEDQGDQAIYELDTALRQIGALDERGRVARPAWDTLFAGELTDAQRHDLVRQAYGLVISLAFMHFKQGSLLIQMSVFGIDKSPEAAAHFRACLDVLGETADLERVLGIAPARVARVVQRMALYFLRATGTDADAAAAGDGPLRDAPADGRAENAVDDWFLGVAQLLVAQNLGTPVGQGLRLAFPDLFDYEHPLATAEDDLRLAIRFEPTLYWPHYMLATALRDRGDYGAAELEFDVCVMLEPDFMLAYSDRALTLARRGAQETDPRRRDDAMTRALADSQRTLDLAPDHPVTYWARGDLMRVLGRRGDAIAAYTRALELDDRVLEKFSRQVALEDVAAYVSSDPVDGDADALTLLAFAALASKQPDQAIDRASAALAARPGAPRALAIRGTARLQAGALDLAAADFDAALRAAPDDAIAALGKAQVLERRGPPAAALAAYEAAARVAVIQAHKLRAALGRARALTALGRTADATAALDEARRIDPAHPLP
jgi:tetratricopeptide (TPR) repeat protein